MRLNLLQTMLSTSSAHTADALVIGAGFSGLAAATTIASEGKHVAVLERHDHAGGRARVFRNAGFTFDMGPSWYWMPDVFEAGKEASFHGRITLPGGE